MECKEGCTTGNTNDKILQLKHWQLFGLLIGLPMVLQFVAVISVIASNDPSYFFKFFPMIMILLMGIYFGWYYALGTNLHKKLPVTAPMNLVRFKVFLFIPLVYIPLFMVFMLNTFSDLQTHEAPNPFIFLLIFPLHLFSMFCMFYCLYFNAKALKTVELQKPVTFSDFAGEFCLLWLFPIGVWIIQPRINKLFDPTVIDENNQMLDSNLWWNIGVGCREVDGCLA